MSAAASDDWHADSPGHSRRVTVADLPAPYATPASSNRPIVVARPSAAALAVPTGFSIQAFATGLRDPRLVRVAPNGDIFVAESAAGRVRALRAADGAGKASKIEIFAAGLDGPFGIAFYPLRGRLPGLGLGDV
jgi:glucose/arabinose dehydrogenase